MALRTYTYYEYCFWCAYAHVPDTACVMTYLASLGTLT